MNRDTERIWVRLTIEKRDRLQEMADKMGLPLSQFVGICAWTGASVLMKALDPEFLQKQGEELINQGV